ncbi:MAG: S8 family serine peptidase, partial [Acidimicrobiia bacterium]
MKLATLHRIGVLLLVPALIFGSTSFAIGGGRATDAPVQGAIGDNDKALKEAIRSGRQVTVIVQLADAPLATYTGGIRGIGATKPAKGKKLDKRTANALGYSRFLSERRAAFRGYLRSNAASAVLEAEYDTTLNGLAITLSGRDLQAVLAGPGVKSVSIDREFRPAMNISRLLIGGPQIDAALTAAGKGAAGVGMKVGIIDSGIQRDHPFFNPSSYSAPAGFPVADNPSNFASCTSAKIIVARAYPKPPGADACDDQNGHGTHVAGTVAGNSGATATIGTVSISGLSGVAHRAWLGNYNVFPNDQASARSVEIIRAIEDGVSDGMDVLNMSLGGPVLQPEQGDPLAQAVNAAAEAGVVMAVAAGNAGPGIFTVSSPGNASGALTAAATTNPHFIGIPVTFDSTTVPAAVGQFGDFVPPLTATLANWNFQAASAANTAATQACSPLTGTPHTGQLVVIDRGICTFTTKVR